MFKDLALDYFQRRIEVLEAEARNRNQGAMIDLASDSSEHTVSTGAAADGAVLVTTSLRAATSANAITLHKSKVKGKDTSIVNDSTGHLASSVNKNDRAHSGKRILKNNNACHILKDNNGIDRHTQNNNYDTVTAQKFSFKRISIDDCSSPSLNNDSIPTPSYKKTKFRNANPITSIPSARLHRNQLTLFDSLDSDYDKPPSASKSIDKTSKNVTDQSPVSRRNKNVKSSPSSGARRIKKRVSQNSLAKLNVAPQSTVGVWITSRSSPQQSPISNINAVDKHQKNNLPNFDIIDSFSDDDVETIHNVDQLLSAASEKHYAINSQKYCASGPPNSSEHGSDTSPVTSSALSSNGTVNTPSTSSTTASPHNDGWLQSSRINKRTPNRSASTKMRNNAGSSTVVILDSDDVRPDASVTIDRTSLNSSVSIGCFQSRASANTSNEPSSLSSTGSIGLTLGEAPVNKFGLRVNNTSTQIEETREAPATEHEPSSDHVECPICSGNHGGDIPPTVI